MITNVLCNNSNNTIIIYIQLRLQLKLAAFGAVRTAK